MGQSILRTIIYEGIILIVMFVSCKISRVKASDFIRAKKIKANQMYGTIILWFASLFLGYCILTIVSCLMPIQISAAAESMNHMLKDSNLILVLIGAVILPSICEEVFFRGFLLYQLRNIKNIWIRILLCAALFGVLHSSWYRILPISILGITMSYLMIKTENLILPMSFHLVNNLCAVIASRVILNEKLIGVFMQNSQASLKILGSILFMTSCTPWMFLLGARLLSGQLISEDGLHKKKIRSAAAILSFSFAASGLILIST